MRRVHLHTIYDAPEAARGELRWMLFHLDGRVLRRGQKAVMLTPRRSVRQATLDLALEIAAHGRDTIYLRIALAIDDVVTSEDTVFLSPPRFLSLPQARTTVRIEWTSNRQARLVFRSNVFQHRFAFELAGIDYVASDNFFDLYPRESKHVQVDLARPVARRTLRTALTFRSLVDSF